MCSLPALNARREGCNRVFFLVALFTDCWILVLANRSHCTEKKMQHRLRGPIQFEDGLRPAQPSPFFCAMNTMKNTHHESIRV